MNNENDNEFEIAIFFFVFTSISFSRVYEFSLKRSFFFISSFEKILQKNKKIEKFSLIHLIIDLYFEKIENSRTNYIKIREILQFIAKVFHNDTNDFVRDFLLKLNNLKKHVRRYTKLFIRNQ